MNKKKILIILLSTLLIAILTITALKIVKGNDNNLSAENNTKIEETEVKNSDETKKEELNEENSIDKKKEKKNSPSIILFNNKAKEITYQKDGEMEKSYYVNGNELGLLKEQKGDIKGLVPYKKDKRLFFADLDFNTIVEIDVVNDNLNIDTIINDNNIKVDDIKELSVINNIMYLTFKSDNQIVEINLEDKAIKKYKVKTNPSNVFKLNGEFYFMDRSDLVKSKDENGELVEIQRIELGAMLSDFRMDDGFLYALSKFGKKENNSVLMKINLSELKVKDIIPLKGIDSEFIGLEDKIAYISQKDSIKEINIETFEPLRAFKRNENEDVQYSDFTLYKLIEKELKRVTLEDMKISDSIRTSFNDFYIVKPKQKNAELEGKENKTEEKEDNAETKGNAKEDTLTPEDKALWEAIKKKVEKEYKDKDGKALSEEELENVTNQIMENESIWDMFYEDITNQIENSN